MKILQIYCTNTVSRTFLKCSQLWNLNFNATSGYIFKNFTNHPMMMMLLLPHNFHCVRCVCDLVGSCCSSIYSYVGMCYVRCEYEQCEYSSYIIHLSSGSIKAKAIKQKKEKVTLPLLCVLVVARMYLLLGYPLQCLGGKVRSCCKMWMCECECKCGKTKLSSYTPAAAKAAPISLSVSYFIMEVM